MKILRHAATALMFLSATGAGLAETRQSLGWGSLFNNDVIDGGQDRWRSASLVVSHLRGEEWTGQRPDRFGALIEYRFRAEMITPSNVSSPSPTDRLYVGALSIGAHTHFQKGATEMSLGVDLVFVGPQTNLDSLQEELHSAFGFGAVNVDNAQVANAVYPTLTYEAGRQFGFGQKGTLRPFLELQAGAETLARVGADVTIGNFGKGALLLRDSTTGQLYSGIIGAPVQGLSATFGGDIAYVADSQYLDTPGIVKEDVRGRLRAGLQQQFKRGAVFFGATYLSEEFEAQPEGQVVGTLSARVKF